MRTISLLSASTWPSEQLRREIHEGLERGRELEQRQNKDIFYGKAGQLTGDDKENVEHRHSPCTWSRPPSPTSTPAWSSTCWPPRTGRPRLTDADRRGLSALFWGHVNLYGRFVLDMDVPTSSSPDIRGMPAP